MDMESIVNGKSEDEPKVEAEAVEQVAEPVEQAEERAPTAPANDEHVPKGYVPLAALEAERNKRKESERNDYRGELLKAQERLRLYEERETRQPSQVDPAQNMAMNFSEQLLRLELKDATDIDANIEKFVAMAKADPALAAGMHASAHPWKYAYTKVKQLEAAREIGDDPASYRAKLRAEIEAEVRASLASPAAPEVKLPTSLASARSAAPRSASSFTGPPPLDQIVNNR